LALFPNALPYFRATLMTANFEIIFRVLAFGLEIIWAISDYQQKTLRGYRRKDTKLSLQRLLPFVWKTVF
jgi:hypothetical protein